MKQKTILLIITLIVIISTIIYFESTKPKIDGTSINSEIQIENLNSNNDINSPEKSLTETDKQRIELKSKKYERAKELVNPDGYINIDNITISENIGKNVILVDFWTYSCINCQRTFPYLTSWYEKYKDSGFIIIGVHTPEFEFEKDYNNVVKATQKWNINYPVIQDNGRQTWRAYKNRYWPRKYIIDIDGFIVYDHIGEGAYSKTEEKIQELLKERNEILNDKKDIDSGIVYHESDTGTGFGRTSEIYFGYEFSREQLGNKEGWEKDEIVNYSFPKSKKKDMFYLDGSWKNNKDDMELISEKGSIYIEYFAKDINIVAGAESPTNVEISIDGKKTKEITIQDFDLYQLETSDKSDTHILELKANKGLRAYTFTFG